MNLDDLKKEIPYKWRVQSFSKFRPSAQCVAYIDARDAMDLLDKVVGPENWQDDYRVMDGQLVAGVGIRFNHGWVWKWDTGTESNMEAEKGKISDAFKRACVKWGVGRFLYRLDIVTLPANEKKEGKNWPYVVDTNNRKVKDLTEHINKMKRNVKQGQEVEGVDKYMQGVDFFLGDDKDGNPFTISQLDAWLTSKKPETDLLDDKDKQKLESFTKQVKARMEKKFAKQEEAA